MTTVVLGESLVDLVWRSGDSSPRAIAGGGPANVAVALHQSRVPVTLLTCWGDDAPGVLVERHLASTGTPIVRMPSETGRTTITLADIDPTTKAASYRFLPVWDPTEISIPDDATLLHTGSIAAVTSPGAQRVLAACKEFRDRPGTVVSIDLNVRPDVEPDRDTYRAAVVELLRETDIVKASEEDLDWLWPDRTPTESAQALLSYGPRLVALTRGANGAVGYTATAKVTVAPPPVQVVDTIGAGDAFHAALLAALPTHDSDAGTRLRIPTTADELESALRRAVRAGALATTYEGAQAPRDWLRTRAVSPVGTASSGRLSSGRR